MKKLIEVNFPNMSYSDVQLLDEIFEKAIVDADREDREDYDIKELKRKIDRIIEFLL